MDDYVSVNTLVNIKDDTEYVNSLVIFTCFAVSMSDYMILNGRMINE
jgi:hypothetical protein